MSLLFEGPQPLSDRGAKGLKTVKEPAHPERTFGLAVAALQQGSLDIADREFKSLLAMQPHHLGALNLRGIVLLRLGRPEEAERCLRKAIRLGSGSDSATLSNYAVALRQLGRSADALFRLDEAWALQPDDPEIWNSRGLVLNDLGRYDDAAVSFEKAIRLRPDAFLTHYNLANSLALLKDYDRALSACDRAIALNADFALAWFGRSQALKVIGNHSEALDAFEQYLSLMTPQELARRSEIIGLAKNLFAFDLVPTIYRDAAAIETERSRLVMLIGEIERQVSLAFGEPGMPCPGVILNAIFSVAGFNIAYQQKNDVDLNRRYANVLQTILGIRNAPPLPRAGRRSKIRFGIASGQLKNHNGTRWALDWLAHLPRSDYSFFVYAFNADLDEVSKKFAALGQFRRLGFNETTVRQTVAAMQADQLDILMLPDVGMTPASRVLSQFRIAPTQFSAWGHPVTTGSPHVDYYLSGDFMEPADAQAHYRETLVRLPHLGLYLKPSSNAVDDALPFALPEGRLLYGCLQSLFKYLPQYDFVFPAIAARVPDCCLLFIEGSLPSITSTFRERLRAAFEREGLDSERFVHFLPRMSAGQFGGLLKRIDVNIDSIGWSGGNTSIQSLELNCPLVTLPAEFMRGRHSYAMLKMIGLEELIARTAEEFVDTLVRLGADQNFRTAMVRKISESKHRLYEDKAFIAGLDQFLKSTMPGQART
jgi:predicted O-linked N-acetylglucosamine transferase (SPINDLY family)